METHTISRWMESNKIADQSILKDIGVYEKLTVSDGIHTSVGDVFYHLEVYIKLKKDPDRDFWQSPDDIRNHKPIELIENVTARMKDIEWLSFDIKGAKGKVWQFEGQMELFRSLISQARKQAV